MRKKLFLLLVLLLFPVVALAGTISVEIDGTAYEKEFSTDFEEFTHDGSVIKVMQNVDEHDSLIFTKKDLTIDINGKTVGKIYVYGDLGTTGLTIKDSLKSGSIDTITLGNSNHEVTAGKALIQDVVVKEDVELYGDADVIFRNATVKDRINFESLNKVSNLTIESGTYGTAFDSTHPTVYSGLYTKKINLLIEDGTFVNKSILAGSDTDKSGSVTIKGGTYTTFRGLSSHTPITIEGGKFTNKDTNDDFIYLYDHSVVDIKNCTYTGIYDLFNGDGTINMYDGTITTDSSGWDGNYHTPILMMNGTFNFYGGTIKANNADSIKIRHFNFGKKSATPNKATPILELRKGYIFMYEDSLNFYGGTMYLREQIKGYKSEVNLYDLVYDKQSDGSLKAYLKSATVQEDAIWTKFKKAFKNNDVLTAMKKVSNYTVTITDNGNSISYTIKDKAMNHTRTVKFSYANGIVSLSNPIKAGEEANKNDMLDSIADMNAISNAVKALADIKGYKYEDLLAFILVNGNDLKIAKDGAEWKYSTVKYSGADLTDAEKKVLGSNPGDYDVTSVFKLDLKNGVKVFNGSKPADAKYTCKRVDGLFYDKDGNVVSKAEYEKACPEKVPDTGFIIPSIIVGILSIGFVAYKKFNFKNKLTRI